MLRKPQNFACLAVFILILSLFPQIATAGFIQSEFLWGPITLPGNQQWIGIWIDASGAPAGSTVTAVDVHYEISPAPGKLSVKIGDAQSTYQNAFTLKNSETTNGSHVSQSHAALTALNGKPVNQRWILWVSQDQTTYNGTLDSWYIKVYYGSGSISYCLPSSGTDYEYISGVQVGSINNSSFSDGYTDYTSLSTQMQIGQSYPVIISNGDPYPADKCRLWIDWNSDFDFDDAGENITLSVNSGIGPYTGNIVVPANTPTGQKRMRVRLAYNVTPSPCGSSLYGEIEDYSIFVVSGLPTVAISGNIKLWNNTPLKDVFLQLYTPDFYPTEYTTFSDSSGHYQFNVPKPWSGFVLAYKDGYVFSNATIFENIILDQTQNFQAHYVYSGGLGTEYDPYYITSAQDIAAIAQHPEDWGNCFLMLTDIDLSEIENFDTIASQEAPFTGSFLGSGYTLSNFTCMADHNNVGLFAAIGTSGLVRDLQMKNVNISAQPGFLIDNVAAIAGKNDGIIVNCGSTGQIVGNDFVAGLVGCNSGIITKCFSNASISGSSNAAGFVASNDGQIDNSYAKGYVSADELSARLASANTGIIVNCYATPHVDSPNDVLVADNSTTLTDCLEPNQVTKNMETYTALGWDFDNTWKICQGSNYPKLAWQIFPGDFVCPDGADQFDYAILASAWKSQYGQPNFNPLCDIAEPYDIIDISDLAVLADNWLTEIEP